MYILILKVIGIICGMIGLYSIPYFLGVMNGKKNRKIANLKRTLDEITESKKREVKRNSDSIDVVRERVRKYSRD